MPTLSNASQMLVLSFPGRPGQWAMMVTNPALPGDPVPARRGRLDGGLAALHRRRAQAGDLEIGAAAAVPGATGAVGVSSATVTMTVLPFDSYTAPAGPHDLRLARAQRGLIWGVCYALHPENLTDEAMGAAMESGRLIAGWVVLGGS